MALAPTSQNVDILGALAGDVSDGASNASSADPLEGLVGKLSSVGSRASSSRLVQERSPQQRQQARSGTAGAAVVRNDSSFEGASSAAEHGKASTSVVTASSQRPQINARAATAGAIGDVSPAAERSRLSAASDGVPASLLRRRVSPGRRPPHLDEDIDEMLLMSSASDPSTGSVSPLTTTSAARSAAVPSTPMRGQLSATSATSVSPTVSGTGTRASFRALPTSTSPIGGRGGGSIGGFGGSSPGGSLSMRSNYRLPRVSVSGSPAPGVAGADETVRAPRDATAEASSSNLKIHQNSEGFDASQGDGGGGGGPSNASDGGSVRAQDAERLRHVHALSALHALRPSELTVLLSAWQADWLLSQPDLCPPSSLESMMRLQARRRPRRRRGKGDRITAAPSRPGAVAEASRLGESLSSIAAGKEVAQRTECLVNAARPHALALASWQRNFGGKGGGTKGDGGGDVCGTAHRDGGGLTGGAGGY
eukprot:TRINITY_DN44910_c0_g1_i1.p1 TRINITY_DN44910_c0_g1~~TRINITY_DN44910_c0_g1_i1.p1  ORF type:complete len:481 (+),score=89.23 TRINITY_DN44910_c0_g1_i1:86-1528(+)